MTVYGGWRAEDGAHGEGRAVDIMVTGSVGDRIAELARANASALGVSEVLWEQQIWTMERSSERWRPWRTRVAHGQPLRSRARDRLLSSVASGEDVAVTIHPEHPFLPAESERSPVRRLRGRLGGAVSLWTTGDATQRSGLTVSSLLVADGEPAFVLALVDPDSDLWEQLLRTRVAVVQLLGWEHRAVADVFAGVAPSPGGLFRSAAFGHTAWGPLMESATTWAGVRLADTDATQVGWSVLAQAVVEHVEVGEDVDPLVHRRGRYVRTSD